MRVDLPAPGGPLMPDPDGPAGVGEQLVEQVLGLAAVVLAGGLGEGDGPGQRPAVAGADALGQIGRGRRVAHPAARSVSSSIMRRAASGMLVPGPNTAATPAFSRKS